MQYILLIVIILLATFETASVKQYEIMEKEQKVFFFSSIATLTAVIFCIFTARFHFVLSTDYLMCSVGFGLCVAMGNISSFYAIKYGSMALVGLVSAYSVMVPILFSLLVWKEKVSIAGIGGLICLLASIFLINDTKEKVMFSKKQVLCLVIVFISGGMCGVFQKMQRLICAEAYANDFLIAGYLIATVLLWGASWFAREKIRRGFGLCVGIGAAKGIASGLGSVIFMSIAGLIPGIILFPTSSAGKLVMGCIVAIVIYKEKLSKRQLIGYAIGTMSIILLNL